MWRLDYTIAFSEVCLRYAEQVNQLPTIGLLFPTNHLFKERIFDESSTSGVEKAYDSNNFLISLKSFVEDHLSRSCFFCFVSPAVRIWTEAVGQKLGRHTFH